MTALAPISALSGETLSATSPSLLLGLIGTGIQASRTPRMHEAECAAQGVRCIYQLIDLDVLGLGVDALPELITAARRFGFAGLNITYPCKQAVIPLLDDLGPEARALGAVNTVIFRDGRSTGHNTDITGFAASFRRDFGDVPRERVVQFGAGGAGAAVSHALLDLGCGELTIIDTDVPRAERLAEALCVQFGTGRAVARTDTAAAVAQADGVVNTTPLGTIKNPGMALPAELLRAGLWVADVNYFPLESELVLRARKRGARAMGGGGMAVFQAVDAFRLFTGREADAARMRRAFEAMGS